MTRRYVAILLSNRTRMLLLLLMPVLLAFLVCVAFEADANFGNFILRHGGDFIRHMFPFKIASHTYSLILSFSCAAFWIGIFNSIQEISKERPIYERERFSGVGVLPYVFSKFIPLMTLCLIQTFCMVVILRFMTNTSVTPDGNLTNETYSASIVKLGMYESFGRTFTTTFLCVLSAMCLGIMISSIASNDMALVLCPVCLMPQILFANVVSELSGFTLTVSNIITAKWSCKAFMISAKEAGTYDEAYTLYNSYTGNGGSAPYEFINVYEDTQRFVGKVSDCWLAMGAICIVCVAAAITILHFRKNQTR